MNPLQYNATRKMVNLEQKRAEVQKALEQAEDNRNLGMKTLCRFALSNIDTALDNEYLRDFNQMLQSKA